MTLNPAVIALLLSSLLIMLMVLYASWFGVVILLRWNLKSGSEGQLALERRTYLVSTLLTYALIFQLISLFLYIFTAENLHELFVGAMCAAGTLNVNPYGYPALLLKVAVFVLAGLWLAVNHADSLGRDYPLIRVKYALLLFIAPLSVAECALVWAYLTGLRADVITSCCGTLFSMGGAEVSQGFGYLAALPARGLFYGSWVASVVAGVWYLVRGRGGALLALASAVVLPASIIYLIVVASPYIYELPTHNCPFCVLQGDYHYIGYMIYAFMLLGPVAGLSAGALSFFASRPSLRAGLPGFLRALVWAALMGNMGMMAVLWASIARSNLVM